MHVCFILHRLATVHPLPTNRRTNDIRGKDGFTTWL